MTTSRYKDLVVLLLFICIALLVVDRCNHDKAHCIQTSTLDNQIAILEVDRLLILDSVDVLNATIEAERLALTNRISNYTKFPSKQRIKLITKIDTLAIPTDTGAILSLHGIDSINVLALSYQSCVVQSTIKDTIITHLSNVIQADSVIIASQQKSMKLHKKTAKINAIKAVLWSGLVGVIIGLVI
jgi:hypothetical protein